MNTVQLFKKAYAKINLSLEVGFLRDDGYHEITTVMQKISLCDEIRLTLFEEGDINLSCDVDVCESSKNLAFIAAQKYLKKYSEKTGKGFGAQIGIKKVIPAQAGLAGGSTDAACVIDLLQSHFSALNEDEIEALASELGCDVPFCLKKYSCALAGGRGTELNPLPTMPDCFIVVSAPGVGLSTPFMYSEHDKNPHRCAFDCTGGMISSLNSKDIDSLCRNIFNSFTPICESFCPEITRLISVMLRYGALKSEMSGSGSAVYGIFRDEASAEKCREKLKSDGIESFLCFPITE